MLHTTVVPGEIHVKRQASAQGKHNRCGINAANLVTFTRARGWDTAVTHYYRRAAPDQPPFLERMLAQATAPNSGLGRVAEHPQGSMLSAGYRQDTIILASIVRRV